MSDNPMPSILVMRHAEKPTPDDVVRGVDDFGRPNPQELSVLGWQRAGALAAVLGNANRMRDSGLRQPGHLFAARPTADKPSVRSLRTLQPLADVLGLAVSLEFAVGEEAPLIHRLRALDACVLVAWEHKAITAIATLLLGSNAGVPACWPDDRYDLVWAFEPEGGGWRMTQIPQLLLAGDRADPIIE
jgi:hypothetical protein